jgi:hypothetical protein
MPRFADVPHSDRQTTDSAAGKRAARKADPGPAGDARNPTARRKASRTDSLAEAWRAKAAKQKEQR